MPEELLDQMAAEEERYEAWALRQIENDRERREREELDQRVRIDRELETGEVQVSDFEICM